MDLSIDHLRSSLGLPDLEVWRDYYLEFAAPPSDADLSAIAEVLGDGDPSRVTLDQPLDPATTVQVAHKRGVVDNESPSLVAVGELLGVPVRAGKVATSYRSADPALAEIIDQACRNASIEELHVREPAYRTLVPAGGYAPAEHFDLRQLSDEELAAVGRAGGRNLSADQMRRIRDIQLAIGAEGVTDVLLEALDARWSDHCLHTTWKSLAGGLLGRLMAATEATGNPNIVSMFADNAGVWEFYGGWSLAIKAETHNGPSAVSAYFGQLTKLGGVLRDILGTGLGADPIGCFEYTATGPAGSQAPIAGRPAPAQIARDTIRAIKEYGNTFGVPMMRSRMAFHPGYAAKPFALGGSIGLIPTDQARRGVPQPGDLVVLIGGLTGNEGMHGASASSAGATMDEAAVQIGAPLEQVKFRKAIIDLRDAGCLRALTDVGGAGLNSAVGEIGEACGVWINTALVPLKTSALPMWRILLSESQERMILAVPPDRLDQARAITARHQVRTTVIGRFAGTGRYRVFHDPQLTEADVVAADQPPSADAGDPGFDIPYRLLGYHPPDRSVGPPPARDPAPPRWPRLDPAGIVKLLEQLAGDPDIACQAAADVQYDSTVQGNTVYGPHYGSDRPVPAGYWAATPVDDLPAAAVFATAFNPWLFDADPARAVRQLGCGLLGRLVLAGVALPDICLCDNFYTPHLAEHADAWLVAMVDELAGLVRQFGTPVISGKDSSAGSTHTDHGLQHVPPAVFLSGLGKVPDHRRLLPEQWTRPGNLLVQIGPATGSPVGTAAARALDLTGSYLDPVDLDDYRRYLRLLAEHRHRFVSGTTPGPGGLAGQLLHGALASGLGADLTPAAYPLENLFAEHRCGAVVEISPDQLPHLPAELRPTQVAILSSRPGLRLGEEDLLTDHVIDHWTNSFAEAIA
ncbi:MAG TPA: AIR synthase-related protein [Natronosporangium sp.]